MNSTIWTARIKSISGGICTRKMYGIWVPKFKYISPTSSFSSTKPGQIRDLDTILGCVWINDLGRCWKGKGKIKENSNELNGSDLIFFHYKSFPKSVIQNGVRNSDAKVWFLAHLFYFWGGFFYFLMVHFPSLRFASRFVWRVENQIPFLAKRNVIPVWASTHVAVFYFYPFQSCSHEEFFSPFYISIDTLLQC